MIMHMVPGFTIFTAGSVTWASRWAAVTAVPAQRPSFPAISGVSRPAKVPDGITGASIFSANKSASPGSSAARNSRGG